MPPALPDRVDAVLLDAGGVLILPRHDLVREALGLDAGAAPGDLLDRAHYEGVAALADFPTEDAAVWDRFNGAYAATLGLEGAEGEAARLALAGLMPQLHVFSQPVPGAAEAVAELAATGRRLAVVSNAQGQVEDLLADIGLRAGEHLDAVFDSAVVGHAKPDPRIFEIALAALGVPAGRAVHVGDILGADVAGAKAAGVAPVHVDPLERCPQRDDHHHVAHLAEVVGLLSP